MDEASRIRVLVEHSALPSSRFRYVPRADEQTIQCIRLGILFIMAFWSGPSLAAFRLLTEAVARMDPDGHLEIIVADIDESTTLFKLPEFTGMPTGVGETAW